MIRVWRAICWTAAAGFAFCAWAALWLAVMDAGAVRAILLAFAALICVIVMLWAGHQLEMQP